MTGGSKIRLGVSACLLGERVRYDGGHKLDRYVRMLGRRFTLVPVCPEFELGLGAPREKMRLEGAPDQPRLVGLQSRADRTRRLRAWSKKRLAELADPKLAGFIFKSKSPSCGWRRTPVFGAEGAVRFGSGLFAAEFTRRFPLLPVLDEKLLSDARARKVFCNALRSRPGITKNRNRKISVAISSR
jgi:uncharacterized protein YbbK (DUF523 family)